jgi:hypothetical protein
LKGVAARKLPGTTLKNATGATVYTPPQDPSKIVMLMRDLEHFINDPEQFNADPLIKMALIHHQFESIHPFYDGNGRSGRIEKVGRSNYYINTRLKASCCARSLWDERKTRDEHPDQQADVLRALSIQRVSLCIRLGIHDTTIRFGPCPHTPGTLQ